MKIDDFNIYKLSMEIGDSIWDYVSKWNYFEKNTIGMQLIRAVDSIGANIAEGFGRYSYKEKRHFCYYARGSVLETRTWVEKAYKRNLIKESDYKSFINILRDLGIKLNNYINTLNKNSRIRTED